jgi:hypothetical protein
MSDLVTLSDVKIYMNLSGSDLDDQLNMFIDQASQMIKNELGCDIVETTYTKEIHNGDVGSFLWLDNWPVTDVSRIAQDRETVLSVTYDSTDASMATVQITETAVKLKKVVSGVTTSNTLLFVDYTTIADLATAINALGSWTTTAVSNYSTWPTTDLIQIPARNGNETEVDLEVPEDTETSCELDSPDKGRLYNPYGWYAGSRNILCDYTAGWSTIPQGIQAACFELVSFLYNLSSKDGSLRSEKIGDYGYTVADRIGAVFSATGGEKISNMIASKLLPYKRTLIY